MARWSRSTKIDGREPLRIHPRGRPRARLGDGDIVRVFKSSAEPYLAGIVVSRCRDARRGADGRPAPGTIRGTKPRRISSMQARKS